MRAHHSDRDRPRPDANQTGAGSPTSHPDECSGGVQHDVSGIVAGGVGATRLGTLKVLPAERAALVYGLFELAVWVCDNPEVPLPAVAARVPSGYHGWRVVDQVAAAVDGSPCVEFGGRRYFVEHAFGPVTVSCTAYGPQALRESRIRPGAARGGKASAAVDQVARRFGGAR